MAATVRRKRKSALGNLRKKRTLSSLPAARPNPTLENLKVIVIYGTAGLIVTGGAVIGIRYLIRKGRQNAVSRDTLDYGSAASFAARLKMAFENDNYFGWGTDVEAVRQIFQEIKSRKLYDAVLKAYSALNPGRQLNIDLKEELSEKEFLEMMRIMSAKPLR